MNGLSSVPNILEGLGKATRRGVRKCPKCGTVNGTRGLSCKNRACDFVFKEPDSDSRKLITPSILPGAWYSVRHSSSSRAFVYSEGAESRCYECRGKSCRRFSTCTEEAVPLTLKVSVLNGMAIEDRMKHEIYLRAKDPGPLVQRVSRSWMVVKKAEESSVPYVHIRFSDKSFLCGCSPSGKCFHFYASMAVFAGDPILSKEFARFTSLLHDITAIPPSVIAILDQNGETLQVEVVESDKNEPHHEENYDFLSALNEPVAALTVEEGEELISIPFSVDEDQGHNTADKNDHLNSSLLPSSPSKKFKPSVKDFSTGKDTVVEYSFVEWLASVAERINQTMHYQFDGKPNPLVFHAPQIFFNRLRERFSLGSKKKRLPNSTTAFVRKDSLPIGTFVKYSWNITNVFHVKQIFDTVLVPLEITRAFVENKDGTYDLIASRIDDPSKKSVSDALASPDLKTYLKVGQMSSDPKEIVPFIIEWIPDILPTMKVGELRIKFEYGHQRNGAQDRSRQFGLNPCGVVLGLSM